MAAATSLRNRVFRGVAAVSVATTILMFVTVFFAYEDMERSMLHLVFADEESFFLSHLDNYGNRLEGAGLLAVFIPEGSVEEIPTLFAGLEPRYKGELHVEGKSYLVHVDREQGGTLYLAKDVTRFERRETLFRGVLIAVVVAALLIGMLLSRVTADRVTRPLSRLAAAVGKLAPDRRTDASPSFPTDFHEAELQQIAHSFSRYLEELDRFMARERRLLSMASHELRTPVSVIAGALDVIEKRGAPCCEATDRALQRIRVATDEMREQINAILTLSRSRATNADSEVDVADLCASVIADLNDAGLAANRIIWSPPLEPIMVKADPTLAKMLVRNLVHNSLQHTQAGEIALTLAADALTVSDQGTGLSPNHKALLGSAPAKRAPTEGGLGLYLVTLIAERLGWFLSIQESPGQPGTTIAISWQKGMD